MNKRIKTIIASILVVTGVTTGTLLIKNREVQEVIEKDDNKKEVTLKETKEEVVENKEEVIEEPVNTVPVESFNEDTTEIVNSEAKRSLLQEYADIETSEESTTSQSEAKNQEEIDNNTSISSNFIGEIESEIIRLVNEERAKASVAALQYNSTMEYYARIKSKDMGDNGYFDHADLNGQLITAQMKSDGVSYNAWGENIAYIGGGANSYQELARSFMNNWMNSDGHRKNILSTNFTGIGVGVYKIGNTYYATQEFYR